MKLSVIAVISRYQMVDGGGRDERDSLYMVSECCQRGGNKRPIAYVMKLPEAPNSTLSLGSPPPVMCTFLRCTLGKMMRRKTARHDDTSAWTERQLPAQSPLL